MSQRDDAKRLIHSLTRKLQKLKEQQAQFGIHTPPYILTEIEDTEAEIDKLVVGLDELDESALYSLINEVSPFSRISPSDPNRRKLLILLQKVKTFWIEGVLNKSIHNELLLDLDKELRTDVINHPWQFVVEIPNNSTNICPPEKKIEDIFEEVGRTLLILGKPGSGKTVTLLELTRNLISRAEIDPSQSIPVVFNLSSWVDKQQPIIDWIVAELNAKYQIPKNVGRSWVENLDLLPLLDGLDEVKPANQNACIVAINQFIENYGLSGVVVCSRVKDYEALSERLSLNGAILLQPLTPSEIDTYLTKVGPALEPLRTTLQTDKVLQELAQSPLMLSVMSIAYQDMPAETLAGLESSIAELRRKHLFDAYIEKMFKHRGGERDYSRKQSIDWLGWLAQKMQQHDQSIFLIERIQPSWLSTSIQRWLYKASILLFIGGIIGLLIGYGGSFPVRLAISFVGRIFGIGIGIAAGLTVCLAITRNFNLVGSTVVGLSFGFAFGLTFYINNPLSVALSVGIIVGLAAGIAFGLVGREISKKLVVDWSEVEIVEKLGWSWSKAAPGLGIGLIAGFTFGMVLGGAIWWPIAVNFGIGFGIAAGLVAGLLNGLVGAEVENKVAPNQGVWQSARNAIIIGLVVALAAGLPIGVVSGLAWSERPGQLEALEVGIVTGVTIGLAFGIAISLFFGGFAVIQHFVLRLILYNNEHIPANYVDFLDYATARIFLRKVGGGYIFVHRLLLEHFVSIPRTTNA